MFPTLTSTGLIRPAWQLMRSGSRIPRRWYGTKGLNTPYRSIRPVLVGRYPHLIKTETDVDRLVESLRDIFRVATEDVSAETVVVITMPEFGLNALPPSTSPDVFPRMGDEPLPTTTFGAHAPITVGLYDRFYDKIRLSLLEARPGIVFVSGGTAVDSGEVREDGKILGLNLAFAAESGADAHVMHFSKAHHDINDGWGAKYGTGVPLTGAGPQIGNFNGMFMLGCTCLDMKIAKLPGDVAKVWTVAAGTMGAAAGWEQRMLDEGVRKGTVFIVNENSSNADDAVYVTGLKGALVVGEVPEHPWLRDIAAQGVWGDMLVGGYEWMFGLSKGARDAKRPGFLPLQTTTRLDKEMVVEIGETVTFGEVAGGVDEVL